MLKKITVEIIPHKKQRLGDVGDYYIDADGNGVVRISDLGNEPWNIALIIHELTEFLFVMKQGISMQEIDEWDKKNNFNGFDKECPYVHEHAFATNLESMVLDYTDNEYEPYDTAIEEMINKGKVKSGRRKKNTHSN